MTNSMFVIVPYRYNGTWVFDDDKVGLVREPFVFGIPEMIDKAVEQVEGASSGFRLLFSASPFPGFQTELTWLREEYEGNWYRWEGSEMEGWLCPALFKYFDKAPAKIFCSMQPVESPASRA